MATSKAAAQAAAEAAAQDVAALSTALMRSEARCQELQAARSEVPLPCWTVVWLAEVRDRLIKAFYANGVSKPCSTSFETCTGLQDGHLRPYPSPRCSCHILLAACPQEVEGLASALQRARDETETVVEDIFDMAAQADRDAERIAHLEAALRDAQVQHLPCNPLIAAQRRLRR